MYLENRVREICRRYNSVETIIRRIATTMIYRSWRIIRSYCLFVILVIVVFFISLLFFSGVRTGYFFGYFFSFYIRTRFLIFNFGNNDLTMNRFIFLSFFLLQDNDSDHNNIPNSKHNNNVEDGGYKMSVESVSFFPHVFNIVRYFFSQVFPYYF